MSEIERQYIRIVGLVLVLGVVFSAEARADLFDTWRFVTGEGGDPLMNQLSVDVTAYGTDQVLFTFVNSGPAASSVTGLYFDDGALLGIADIFDAEYDSLLYPGVYFTQDVLDSVAPPDLPG